MLIVEPYFRRPRFALAGFGLAVAAALGISAGCAVSKPSTASSSPVTTTVSEAPVNPAAPPTVPLARAGDPSISTLLSAGDSPARLPYSVTDSHRWLAASATQGSVIREPWTPSPTPGGPPRPPHIVSLAAATQPAPPAPGDTAPPGAQAPRVIRIPVGDPTIADKVQIEENQERISLTARDAPMDAVLALLAEQHGLNIVAGTELEQHISVKLNDVSLEDALDAIVTVNGYTWTMRNNIVTVTAVDASKKTAPALQGRQVRVFTLNYVSCLDVDKVVKGLLSPVGQSFTNQALPTDQRRTVDQLIVEDLPAYVQRVGEYIQQVDVPPMQVVVEAQVLQVTLKDDYRHGVNFSALARIANGNFVFETVGLANASATPTSFLHVNGHDLKGLVEFLYATTDAKTLATPKVTVVNGQAATIQIGQKLGYKTLQQTQTSTLQNVQFLDTGVILKVTPIITQDGQIMLKVNPSVSDGAIDANSGLPNSNTTTVDTNVLLCDGEAIVLGGLIKEQDNEVIGKIPILGDIKYIGWIFRRVQIQHERTEIIIALQPRIVSPIPGTREPNQTALQRVHTDIVGGPLLRVDRTQWEPELPQRRPTKARLFPGEFGDPEEAVFGPPPPMLRPEFINPPSGQPDRLPAPDKPPIPSP